MELWIFLYSIDFLCTMNLAYRIGKIVYPNFTWTRKTQQREVFITFDDGPHPEITPWVLQTLEKYKARASFFVVGENANKFGEVMQNIRSKGHSIGNHTYHHLKGWSTDATAYLNDIDACANVLGERRLFRPPYGRINSKTIQHLDQYEIIMWDVLSGDYRKDLNTDQALARMKSQVKPGSIIVFHDSLKAEKNLRILLPLMLQYLSDNNYSFGVL